MVFSQLKHGGKFESASYHSYVFLSFRTQESRITKSMKKHQEEYNFFPKKKDFLNGRGKVDQGFPSLNNTRDKEGFN